MRILQGTKFVSLTLIRLSKFQYATSNYFFPLHTIISSQRDQHFLFPCLLHPQTVRLPFLNIPLPLPTPLTLSPLSNSLEMIPCRKAAVTLLAPIHTAQLVLVHAANPHAHQDRCEDDVEGQRRDQYFAREDVPPASGLRNLMKRLLLEGVHARKAHACAFSYCLYGLAIKGQAGRDSPFPSS